MMRQHLAALRALLVLTAILGVGYPLFIWLVAQLPGLDHRANGSLLEVDGKVVGSSLIGQSFTDAEGNPLPRYFQSRPGSYDPMASGGSNLGPESTTLLNQVHTRDHTAPDAMTASGSGLDPDISPANAEAQVSRVASARGLKAEAVRELVAQHTTGRTLGFMGEPRVNVLELNIALDRWMMAR